MPKKRKQHGQHNKKNQNRKKNSRRNRERDREKLLRRNQNQKNPKVRTGQLAIAGRKVEAADRKHPVPPSLKKQLAKKAAGKMAGKSVSVARNSARKYGRKQILKAKELIKEMPGQGPGADQVNPNPAEVLQDIKKNVSSVKRTYDRSKADFQRVYRTAHHVKSAYRMAGEYRARHPKKDSKKKHLTGGEKSGSNVSKTQKLPGRTPETVTGQLQQATQQVVLAEHQEHSGRMSGSPAVQNNKGQKGQSRKNQQRGRRSGRNASAGQYRSKRKKDRRKNHQERQKRRNTAVTIEKKGKLQNVQKAQKTVQPSAVMNMPLAAGKDRQKAAAAPQKQIQAAKPAAKKPVGRSYTRKRRPARVLKAAGRKNTIKRQAKQAVLTADVSRKAGKAVVKGSGKATLKTVQTTAKTTKVAAAAAIKAGSAAVQTVAAVTETSVKAAATAATGGGAGVGFAVQFVAKKILQTFRAAWKNNPFTLKAAFKLPGMEGVAGEIVQKASRKLLMMIAIPIIALALVSGGFLFLLSALTGAVSSSPIRYVVFSPEELEELAPLIQYMDESAGSDAGSGGYSGDIYREQYLHHRMEMEQELAAYRAAGYQIIYAGYEGNGVPDNYLDAVSCLLGASTFSYDGSYTYTAADAMLGSDAAVEAFASMLQEMCSIRLIESDEEHRAIVTLMDCETYIAVHGCSAVAAERIRSAYRGLTGAGTGTDTDTGSIPEDVAGYCQGLTHLPAPQGTVISSGLAKVGTPYSKTQRDSGSYYDCSSFVYYAYQSAGINIVHAGANTAAAEAQYCAEAGHVLAVSELQPGDLLFYSYVQNGRYLNISHVEMYLGNGLIIDCTETPGVSVRPFTDDRLVMCGRPY